VFQSITKQAVTDAMKHRLKIDDALVLLSRPTTGRLITSSVHALPGAVAELPGFTLGRPGASVALRLVCDREFRDQKVRLPREYWSLIATLVHPARRYLRGTPGPAPTARRSIGSTIARVSKPQIQESADSRIFVRDLSSEPPVPPLRAVTTRRCSRKPSRKHGFAPAAHHAYRQRLYECSTTRRRYRRLITLFYRRRAIAGEAITQPRQCGSATTNGKPLVPDAPPSLPDLRRITRKEPRRRFRPTRPDLPAARLAGGSIANMPNLRVESVLPHDRSQMNPQNS